MSFVPDDLIDPMTRLPVEISSDILAQSLPMPRWGVWKTLTVLLRVCHRWREIALSSPAVWSTISDEGIPVAKFVDLLDIWLARAGELPVSVTLSYADLFTLPGILLTLKKHVHRIQSLHVLTIYADVKEMTFPMPALRSLTLASMELSASQALELLRAAPSLVECNFDQVYFEWDTTPMPLTHPKLRELRFGRLHLRCCSAELLRYLTLPALRTLAISLSKISVEDLCAFLTRSAPPLRHLHLRVREEDIGDELGIIPVLELMPGLTDLEIVSPAPSKRTAFGVFAAAPHLLPGLQNLLVDEQYRHSAEDYQLVLDFLEKRRALMRSLWFVVEEEERVFDSEDEGGVGGALRAFRTEGMRVHFGRYDSYYLMENGSSVGFAPRFMYI
ncbi:hypothetical protein FB45DRAFT_1065143 [Roridomyces roridus]|uniref:F-box domain-containing protein n=1 Tax=Roridomyces roridus TaxID=1738132 RepID=A0AAD7B7L9_9AGAR|nr:hypothetical protein FB45DRAFT_1065143 [Roridomyces roridus]